MSNYGSNFAGGNWDLGGFITEQILAYPVSRMISNVASESGIDMHNPVRSVVSFLASGFMGSFIGSFLGPFGGLIGGLLGETLAVSGSYPGDWSSNEWEQRRKAEVILKVKALAMASEMTRDNVSSQTWNAIVDQFEGRVNALGSRMSTEQEALGIAEDIICSSIRSVNYDVYQNFMTAYWEIKRQLGV